MNGAARAKNPVTNLLAVFIVLFLYPAIGKNPAVKAGFFLRITIRDMLERAS